MKNIKSGFNYTCRLISCLALILSVAALVNLPLVHAAGTKTWSNTDCTGGSPNCNWSDINNWVGGIVPVSGDDIIFDNSTLIPANNPSNDINGLAVNSLTFINAGSGANTIILGGGFLGGDLTVNTSVSQSASATTNDLIKGTLILGGNVTFTGNGNNLTIGSSSAGQPNDILNLNAHTANFVNVVIPGSSPTVTVNDIISGNGVVTYNGSNTKFLLKGLNTYSGTTNVIASSTWVGGDVIGQHPFGSSSIIVSSSAGIKFDYPTNVTVSNNISLTGGSATSSLPISINFANSGISSMTYTLPNITLLGNVRLSNNTLALVNLTGITANNHCIEYLTNGTIVSTPFTGGPAICVTPIPVVVSPATNNNPKAPNTGLAYVGANPIITLVFSFAALIIMIYSLRKLTHK